jgi:hypothetical protein
LGLWGFEHPVFRYWGVTVLGNKVHNLGKTAPTPQYLKTLIPISDMYNFLNPLKVFARCILMPVQGVFVRGFVREAGFGKVYFCDGRRCKFHR